MSALRYALAAPTTLTRKIRKSRFVVHAASVAAPEGALAFVAAVADAGATHNCWAYRIGQQYRFNDAGEPAGTAGKPILQAIDAQHCCHTIVVVTRWFGGIKLGAGGLARAYGGCVAECLRLAAKTELIELATVEFALPFSAVPVLHCAPRGICSDQAWRAFRRRRRRFALGAAGTARRRAARGACRYDAWTLCFAGVQLIFMSFGAIEQSTDLAPATRIRC